MNKTKNSPKTKTFKNKAPSPDLTPPPLMKPKNIVLLGCTGSIGVSTQKVAADLPEQIRIVGMASRDNVDGLEKAVRQFKPLAVGDDEPREGCRFEEAFRAAGQDRPTNEGLGGGTRID